MPFCGSCGKPVSEVVKFCVQCGAATQPQVTKPQPTSLRTGCLVVILILIILVFFTVLFQNASNTAVGRSSTSSKTTVAPAGLELLGSDGQMDAANVLHIKGSVRNNTSHRYGYVQISFSVYNDATEKVGTAWANVSGLDPGEIWRFDAVSFVHGGRHFRFEGISGR